MRRAQQCAKRALWITLIRLERINTHGGRKKYEAPSRCADDIVSRGQLRSPSEATSRLQGRNREGSSSDRRCEIFLGEFDCHVSEARLIVWRAMQPHAFAVELMTLTPKIAGFGAHWGAADLQTHLNHPTPAVQLFTVLRGVFSITVTDGETRQLHAGDIVLLEDITPCTGHITVVGDKPGFLLFAR